MGGYGMKILKSSYVWILVLLKNVSSFYQEIILVIIISKMINQIVRNINFVIG